MSSTCRVGARCNVFHAAAGICHGELARWPSGPLIASKPRSPPRSTTTGRMHRSRFPTPKHADGGGSASIRAPFQSDSRAGTGQGEAHAGEIQPRQPSDALVGTRRRIRQPCRGDAVRAAPRPIGTTANGSASAILVRQPQRGGSPDLYPHNSSISATSSHPRLPRLGGIRADFARALAIGTVAIVVFTPNRRRATAAPPCVRSTTGSRTSSSPPGSTRRTAGPRPLSGQPMSVRADRAPDSDLDREKVTASSLRSSLSSNIAPGLSLSARIPSSFRNASRFVAPTCSIVADHDDGCSSSSDGPDSDREGSQDLAREPARIRRVVLFAPPALGGVRGCEGAAPLSPGLANGAERSPQRTPPCTFRSCRLDRPARPLACAGGNIL